jgi:hypothetical protein
MFRPLLISLCLICSAVSAKTPVYEDYKLLASDGASSDSLGRSVSISSDGTTAIVGAYRDSFNESVYSGSAYIYELVGGVWEETKLTASDAASNDEFGVSVSISADGTTAIVGADRDDDDGTDSGSAYIYELVGGVWEETKLTASDGAFEDRFGWSVSISADGTTAIIGNWSNSGSVYVYKQVSGVWEETKLTASDGASYDYFGYSVSISADGTTAIVGALWDDDDGTDSGSAYIYELVGGVWEETKLTASDGAFEDLLGYSVSISDDGTTALVGAIWDDDNGENSGSSYIYRLVKGAWQETKLVASDGQEWDYFGFVVCISSDGTTALVGAVWDDDNGNLSGSAYIYKLVGGVWQETKLLASDGEEGDIFGWSVSISSDGTTALVGAWGDGDNGPGSGSAYIFVIDGSDCPDINGDGYVNVTDLLAVIDQWGLANSPADVNFDGIVDVSDLLIVVGNWGPCE